MSQRTTYSDKRSQVDVLNLQGQVCMRVRVREGFKTLFRED